MAVRIPQSFSASHQRETGWSMLSRRYGPSMQKRTDLTGNIVDVPCWMGQPTSSGPS